MNSYVLSSIIQLKEGSLKELVQQVKETLATDMAIPPKAAKESKFGVLDLWNCQRNVRTAISMRRF